MLDYINQLLVDRLGPMGPLMAIGGLGLLLILLTLPIILKKPPEPFDKIKSSFIMRSY